MAVSMKTLSYSAIEILPALLSKKKDQTIRPLWKKPKGLGVLDTGTQVSHIRLDGKEIPPDTFLIKW